MENFLNLAEKMRAAQKEYYLNKTFENFQKAKVLESRFDESIKIQKQKIINLKRIQAEAALFNNGYQY